MRKGEGKGRHSLPRTKMVAKDDLDQGRVGVNGREKEKGRVKLTKLLLRASFPSCSRLGLSLLGFQCAGSLFI